MAGFNYDDSKFSKFEKKIGIEFSNQNLLKQAFTHRSYLNENPSWLTEHNERLEFLGDAVLELAITEFLFRKYPQKTEGEMTSLRAALVNTNMLSETAMELSMGDFVMLSKGEKKGPRRAQQAILANAFEAVVGAIYLDKGFQTADAFLRTYLTPKLDDVIAKKTWIDSKSLFQEKAQDVVGVTPNYKVLSETGPDHAKNFTIGIYLGEEMIAQGDGLSKHEAEQSAARAGLALKGWN